MSKATIDAMAKYMDAIEGEVDRLRGRVAALEGRGSRGEAGQIPMRYIDAGPIPPDMIDGEFDGTIRAQRGMLFTKGTRRVQDGATWHALRDTDAQPGGSDWLLIADGSSMPRMPGMPGNRMTAGGYFHKAIMAH